MNERLWERWVEHDATRSALWQGKEILRRAWADDRRYPKSYPMNTSYAMSEILYRLSSRPKKEGGKVVITKPKTPTNLAELFPEKLVKAIWEENHVSSFEHAIRKAAVFEYSAVSKKVLSQILRTMEIAFHVRLFGDELLPVPKTSILHKGLARVFRAAGLEDQSDRSFTMFLDDLCPCGLRSHSEAVRKSRSRSGGRWKT